MATAKQLVPGIHSTAEVMAWQGTIARPISVQEAVAIAEQACTFSDLVEEMTFIREEIERVTAIPSGMLAN